MSAGPQAALLPDGKRLHLHHGPIDLVIGAQGTPGEVRRAYDQARARFEDILAVLVEELAMLRRPVRAPRWRPGGPVARRMMDAAWPQRGVFVTPMAQQLIQEFLFHLVASIQFLAQDVNQLRGLSIAPLDVTPVVVCRKLQNGDSVKDLLLDLHPKTRNKSLPAKPYSVQGMHFRIIITRNYVCHSIAHWRR